VTVVIEVIRHVRRREADDEPVEETAAPLP
jgi:hypothetical protein